ncbi:ribonucleotide-diphosphate reductase subunit beta [bacterium]|nr:ribonucleotide-diphosphate reductase subunit beta [bacterium]
MSTFFTDPDQKRLVLLPIRHANLWNIFKEQQSVLWTTEEIDWAGDVADWHTLDDEARRFLLRIIAFFASSDMLVVDNLMDQFMSEVTVAECRAFYTLQAYIESIHSETYATALDKFAPSDERDALFDAIAQEPTIKAKGDFATKYMNAETPFVERLWAFCIFEGVLFAASFASLYWLRTKDKCKGLTFSNELIQRDESIHAKFGIEMLNTMHEKGQALPSDRAQEILKEAVGIEEAFVRGALPQNLVGLGATDMIDYVRYCADRLLTMLNGDYPRIWNAPQPFAFMEMISIDSKTNFFEKRVAEYTMAGVGNTAQDNGFSLEEDF